MFELIVEETKDGWEFIAVDKEGTVSSMQAIKHGDDVVIHNEVYRWNKENAKCLQEMFFDVRGFLKEKGVKLIIPCTDQKDKKIKRFWKFMGFECFGKAEGINFAVMEA